MGHRRLPVTCSSCGTSWSQDEAAFCGNCGARLPGNRPSPPSARPHRRNWLAVLAGLAVLAVGVMVIAQAQPGLHDRQTPDGSSGSSTEASAAPNAPVACLRDATSEPSIVWSCELPDWNGPLLSVGRRAYVGTLSGEIMAFSVPEGRAVWRIRATPGPVLPLVGSSDTIIARSDRGVILAIDARGGVVRWRTPPGHVPGSRFLPSAMIGDVAVLANTGGVTGLDVRNGRRLWGVDTPGRVRQMIAIGRSVAIATPQALMLVEAGTGADIWSLPEIAPGAGTVQTLGQDLVVQSDDGRVARIDAASGRVSWMVGPPDAPAAPGMLATTPDGVVVVGRQLIAGLDPGTGAVRWTDGRLRGPIVIHRDRRAVVVSVISDDGGRTLRIKAQDGFVIWDRMPALTEADDVAGILIGTGGCQLCGFELATGSPLMYQIGAEVSSVTSTTGVLLVATPSNLVALSPHASVSVGDPEVPYEQIAALQLAGWAFMHDLAAVHQVGARRHGER